MEAVLTPRRCAPVILALVVGIAASLLSTSPIGLLAPIAALYLFARRAAPLLHVALAVAAAGALLLAASDVGAMRDAAQTWAAIFSVALCIGVMIASSEPMSPDGGVWVKARDEARPYPAIGPTLREKVAPRSSRSVGIAAQDDDTTPALMLAASFWGGTPFHLRYWRTQPEGDGRWTEVRTETSREPYGTQQWRSFSTDVVDQRSMPRQPMKTASNPSNNDEAVQAARIVESLLGNAWAFDANGRPTYLSPFAQSFVSVTLEEFQASVDEGDTVFKRTSHPDEYDRIATRWRHSLQSGEPFYIERRIRRASGIHDWSRTAIVPIRDRQGSIAGWYGGSMDLDAYRTVELELLAREQELSQLVDMVPSHVWRLMPDGEPTFFNKRMQDFLGLDVSDTNKPGMSRLAVLIDTAVHRDDAAAFRDALTSCLASGEIFAMRYRLRRVDGIYRWMSSRAEPMCDHTGRILHWYGLCHDIDDQVRAEEELRASKQQLEVLVDAIPAFIWCLTPEGAPSYFNKRVLDQIGLTVEDLTASDGSLRLESVHPADRPRVQAALEHSLKSGEPFAIRYRQRRGKTDYRWTEGNAEPLRDADGAIVQWYGVYRDIDDQVRAEEELLASKRQLEQMIDAVPVNILSFSPSGKLTYASRRYLDRVGSPPSHIEDFDALAQDVAHPEDFPTMFRRASNGFATGQPFVNRFRRREKDGAYRWIEARAQSLRDANGAIVQWYIASIDIEDEMRAQEALRERERTLRQLVETLPAMIDCAAPNGEPIYRSRQLRDFLGYELEELDGEARSRLQGTLEVSVHPDDLAGVKDDYAHSLSTGEPYARRHRLRHFDGAYRWVETRAAPMRGPDGAIVQWNVICLDIDGEVRAQIELRSAQEKMARANQAASLAELSASIAHEVNQPLAAIVATSHACRRWLSADPPNLERAGITLDRIIRDANSASEVVSRIRALFSQANRSRTRADMTEVIDEVCLLLADDLDAKNMQVETEFGRTVPQTLIDRVQMQQVLVNLIRNAIDAMEGIVDRPRLIRIRAVPDGAEFVRFELQDHGTGLMEPERAFEPFVTTKQNGMGMGLAICRSIIEAHDGRLWVFDSSPGGTTLAFTLPIEARASA